MPIDPSALPWWGWLVCGVGGGMATLITSRIAAATKDGMWAMVWWLAGIMTGLVGIISFVIGVVRFAKWAWS